MNACHCLCPYNHPDETGVCTAKATKTVSFSVPGFGPIEVPMCKACAQATRLAAEAGRR
jgi:hypothetical protein